MQDPVVRPAKAKRGEQMIGIADKIAISEKHGSIRSYIGAPPASAIPAPKGLCGDFENRPGFELTDPRAPPLCQHY